MLWVKSFHVFMVMSWMGAVFYLPRLLVNLVEAREAGEPTQRLEGMARRLYRFGFILAAIALALGVELWRRQGFTGGWIYWKLALVAALIGYYFYCGRTVQNMGAGRYPNHGPTFYRILNEIGVFIVFPIVVLAVMKLG